MKQRTSLGAALKFWMLSAGLVLATANVLDANPAFSENFNSFGPYESVVGKGWRFKAGYATNSAYVGAAGSHVTVTANGNGDRLNARLAPDAVANLPVSDGVNNRISTDIRWTSPGTSGNPTVTYFQAQTDDGSFNMGFSGTGLFFTIGGATLNPEGIVVDPDAWYRFTADFTPSTGVVDLRVLKLGETAAEIVWTGNSLQEGGGSFSPTRWSAIEVDVTRPGSSGTTSSDFDNIVIEHSPGVLNPDVVLNREISSHTSSAVALEFDAARGSYYRIRGSDDLMSWTQEGSWIYGNNTPVRRFYSTEEMDRGFFRVTAQ